MSSDSELLLRFARDRCEHAFAQLVRAHLDLVYSAAARRVGGDPHAAAEITQEVFIAMARNAEILTRHPVLNAWLHTSTRNAAANLRRRDRRHELQKQKVHAMQELQGKDGMADGWEAVRGVLDEALDELSEQDRQAIILRFFEGHSYPLIGGMLGLREEAARMRVGRALEKLRARLARRGIVSTAAVLGGGLGAHAIVAAPAGLAASVTVAATTSAVAGVAAPAAIGLFQFMSIAKISAIIVGAVAIGAAWFVYQRGAAKGPESGSVAASSARPVAAMPLGNDPAGGLEAVVEDHRTKRSPISTATMEAEEKIAALRDVLGRLPEQSIPELKLATNGDWHAAVDGALETPEDYRRALGKIRAAAERRFAAILQPALRAYLTANGGKFPTSPVQLQTLAGEEISRAMLERYKVAPATEVRNVRVGGEWAITQSALIDSEYDSHAVIGPNGFGATNFTVVAQRELDIMMPAIRAYKAAHGERHADVSQLVPYAITPEQKAVVQKWLRKQAAQ